jgi:hypothetical protein
MLINLENAENDYETKSKKLINQIDVFIILL